MPTDCVLKDSNISTIYCMIKKIVVLFRVSYYYYHFADFYFILAEIFTLSRRVMTQNIHCVINITFSQISSEFLFPLHGT